ncbi:cytochrome C [Vitiosangium sp. GDMCC 1.1324]|uniref:cytochrome C n=1 Tax=Vitiosangium sp. (strain GDMCC 1.1324) TaxID=2138576 RepID=UPI000D3D9274|nr:cytochrome C [Vitiosangium sp. GDMCC 1.1324]PTL80037.1 cytochrome C [Vitiosangium sp. GDMCC 1.1324]
MSGKGALCVPSHPSVRIPGRMKGVWLAALALLGAGCSEQGVAGTETPGTSLSQSLSDAEDLRPSPGASAVGLALEVEDGAGVPLKVRAGQTFYINQIDLRATATATKDEGVDGLRKVGDFAKLPWQGLALVDEEPVLLPNADKTFTRRRFYRSAKWMEQPSVFTVQPVDARGRPTGRAIPLHIGKDDQRKSNDDFFIRRLRAIQWTKDCRSVSDCTGAKKFEEEALVEVRNARTGATWFSLSPDTRALRVSWSVRPGEDYSIPVEQVARPTYAYGFSIDVKAVTPPRADGTYAPGASVTFQLALRDGAGKRLHPEGSLPSYNEVVFGQNEPGIQYYSAFFDPTTTYYRRKHRERMLMTQIIGPAQRIQPIRSIIDMPAFLDLSNDVQTVGTLERDGVFSQFQTFPPANKLFGGAFYPNEGRWDAPVSDTWTYKLPANAEPGTYLVTVKGRRVFMGEDIPASRTIEIQVGTTRHTEPKLTTGPCNSCHSEGGELSKVLHGNDNRAACAGCHAPLGFELEGPIFVRTHFIHSRSDRFDAPKEQCSSCHLTKESIQRTSQAACLSCHKSYPESHVKEFGPIESMYVGGERKSFLQCTGSCHKTHPGSGL